MRQGTTRVLMVCLGNICRSPMAEGILRHRATEARVKIEVDSAGTSSFHVGETPDVRAIATMRSHGIDISTLRGRQVKAADLDKFSLILTMDCSNLRDVLRLCRTDAQRAKVRCILPEDADVPDPYYGAQDGFEQVFSLLDRACRDVLTDLQ